MLRQSKVSCTVNGQPGMAHLRECPLRDDYVIWFAEVDVVLDARQCSPAPVGATSWVELEDGRRGIAYVLGWEYHRDSGDPERGEAPSRFGLLTVTGLSPLEAPRPAQEQPAA